MSDERDTAGVVAPPPLIYGGALGLGILANRALSVSSAPRRSRRVIGWPLIGGGLTLGLWGLRSLKSAGTNVDPYRPTTAFVTDGPYRFTRNPLYLGLTAVYMGISALAGSLWAVLLLPGVLTVMRRGVIEREERYLEGKFGEEYRRYKERVRRWI